MGVVTRCPACKTLFRIVPDRLASSAGWARCGVCGESFDSAVQRYQVIEPEIEVSSTGGVATPVQVNTTPPYLSPLAGTKDLESDQFSTTSHSEPAFAAEGESPLPERFSDHLLLAEQSFGAVNRAGFMSAGATAQPQGRATRLFLVLSSVLLGFGLMFQVAIQERGPIASRFPDFQSLLQSICGSAACNATPLRNIDALIIDGSSFVTRPDGAHLLSVTVKNTSAGILAVPWVELVLTDGMEQIIVRKVLTPSELGAQNGHFSPAEPWTGTATLNVDLPAGAEPFTGYRVLVFYP